MRLLQPTVAFPMHMVDNYAIIDRLKAHPCSLPYRNRIANICACGVSFEL